VRREEGWQQRSGPGLSAAARRARRSAARLPLEPVDSIEALREDWNRLAEYSGNIFGTPEWAQTWWETHGDGHRLLVHAYRPSREPVQAVFPLYVGVTRPLHVARFLGHGSADELGPVCHPRDRPDVAVALRQLVLRELGSRGLLLAERMDGSVDWRGLLGGHVLRHEPAPVLRVEARSGNEWLASKKGHFRRHLHNLERRVRREHDLEFRLVKGGPELEPALATLFELHAARWGAASRSFSGPRRAFHTAFARRAAARGWLRLWFADVDGHAAAAWLNYRLGDVEWAFQAGRDPAWSRSSLGFLLIVHTILACFDDGLREFRFGRGAEAYKARLASDDPGLDTLAIGRPPLPLLARTTMRLAARTPARARRLMADRLNF
jgi:CelD/BcsL family acetyltransferase involved in cellulose biosynthesis